MKSLLVDLRPMRIILYFVVLVSMIFKAAPGTELVYEGWSIFPTLLFPVFAPILVMLLWLDCLIAKLWSTQTEGKEQARYKMILWIDLILSVVFVSVWTPFFIALSK